MSPISEILFALGSTVVKLSLLLLKECIYDLFLDNRSKEESILQQQTQIHTKFDKISETEAIQFEQEFWSKDNVIPIKRVKFNSNLIQVDKSKHVLYTDEKEKLWYKRWERKENLSIEKRETRSCTNDQRLLLHAYGLLISPLEYNTLNKSIARDKIAEWNRRHKRARGLENCCFQLNKRRKTSRDVLKLAVLNKQAEMSSSTGVIDAEKLRAESEMFSFSSKRFALAIGGADAMMVSR